ncbi:hypothetical protein R6Q59_003025 [Mikania micrantha]
MILLSTPATDRFILARPPPIGHPCSIRSPPIDIITAPSCHHRSTYPCSTKPPPIDFIFAPPGHDRVILFQMPLSNTEMSTREVNLRYGLLVYLDQLGGNLKLLTLSLSFNAFTDDAGFLLTVYGTGIHLQFDAADEVSGHQFAAAAAFVLQFAVDLHIKEPIYSPRSKSLIAVVKKTGIICVTIASQKKPDYV